MSFSPKGAPVNLRIGQGPNAVGPYKNPVAPPRYRLTGLTVDSAGAALGACTVDVFESASRLYRGQTQSDANGNYSIDVTGSGTGLVFQAIAYKAGSPDVAGVTLNTLVPTEL